MKKNALILICLLNVFTALIWAQKIPVLDELKEVAQLPAEIPQRASAIGFDGRKLWIPIYLDHGRYVKYDPSTDKWDLDQDASLRQAISKVAGNWTSPGGIVFVDGKMWIGSFYGDSFGWIDVNDPSQSKKYTRLYKPDLYGSQSYADLAYDGTYIWAEWHSFNHKAGMSKTQLLLKIDKETGEILSEFPIPFGRSADGARSLTWDGTRLWHATGNILRSLDENGAVISKYRLPGLQRSSGIAWDGDSLWIIECGGKLWRLPLR